MTHRETIQKRIEFEADPVRGSRFIGIADRAVSQSDAFTKLKEIRGEAPDATHHCWAWRISDHDTRCSDDGEPRGSAGPPILRQIESRGLVETLVVVRRRYGGVKLGVGGLVRAYGAAARAVIDAAEIIEIIKRTELCLIHDYESTRQVDSILRRWAHDQIDCSFGERVRRRILVEEDDATALIEAVRSSASDGIDIEPIE